MSDLKLVTSSTASEPLKGRASEIEFEVPSQQESFLLIEATSGGVEGALVVALPPDEEYNSITFCRATPAPGERLYPHQLDQSMEPYTPMAWSRSLYAAQQVATMAINNFIKVRNCLGIELSAAFMELPDEELEQSIVKSGLSRDCLAENDLALRIEQLVETLPEVNWDAEAVADALYCDVEQVHDFVKKFSQK